VSRLPCIAALFALLILAGIPLHAAEPADPTPAAEELMRRERARAAVVQALEDAHLPADSGEISTDNLVNAVYRLAEHGSDVVPFLTAELEQVQLTSFPLCAYALGLIPTPESEEALRRAMLRADADGPRDGTALQRKAWAGWALGLQGKAETIDQLNTGRILAARFSIHAETSALEAAALQTAPLSIPPLLAQLERYTADPALRRERTWTLRALRRIGDPATVPNVAAMLGDPEPLARLDAAFTLSTMRTREAVQALVGALKDPEVGVRRAAAGSLEAIRLNEALPQIQARLEAEEDGAVRAALYKTIALAGDSRTMESLRKYWGRPDPIDREGMVEAAQHLGGRDSVELLRRALEDPETRVAVEAAHALGQIGSSTAVSSLLKTLSSPRWPVVMTSIEELVRLRSSKAGPIIADRLLREQLAQPIAEPVAKVYIEKLGEALVDLRHFEPAAQLREAATRQTDAGLVDYLDRLSRRLDLLRENRRELSRWVESLSADDADLRRLSYEGLADVGGEQAAAALRAAFETAAPDDRMRILDALGRMPVAAAHELVERVLVDPEFDPAAQLPLREMAAWSARRLGGARMLEALRASAERRDGREAKVLIYLAVLGGKQALPVLASTRVPRMRYLKWTRGKEQARLDAVARDVAAGFPLDYVDVPPSRIIFY
jgi:HEAT repeat protein